MVLDVTTLCKANVSQFYGIEIEPFPSEIAKVSLWLMEHLCNLEVADRLGQYFARIPIKASPHIVCTDALTMDWRELLDGSGALGDRALPTVGSAPRADRKKTIYACSTAIPAAHINGYLCDAPDAFIENRSKPICDVPPMNFGNMPRDDRLHNFIWPENDISAAAQEILDIRRRYLDADKSCSLATLYDPLFMPPELVKAHAKLDALVEKAYGRTFASDDECVAHLFNLYAEAVKAKGSENKNAFDPDFIGQTHFFEWWR